MHITDQDIKAIQNVTAEKAQAELRAIEEKRQQNRRFMERVEATHPASYWDEVPYRDAMDYANYLNDLEMYLEARLEELTPCELVVSFR